MRVHFGRREPQFVGEVIAGNYNATQDIAHFRFIVDQAQQRFAARTFLADTQDILSGRVEANDQQVLIEQGDAGA